MSDVPSVAELDALSTEELRHRAFDRAEHRRDVGFFWDLLRHLPPTEGMAAEDGSSGHITGGIAEAVQAARELLGGDLGEVEPLVRARFIDYLRQPG
jgi:hypothetical protein